MLKITSAIGYLLAFHLFVWTKCLINNTRNKHSNTAARLIVKQSWPSGLVPWLWFESFLRLAYCSWPNLLVKFCFVHMFLLDTSKTILSTGISWFAYMIHVCGYAILCHYISCGSTTSASHYIILHIK